MIPLPKLPEPIARTTAWPESLYYTEKQIQNIQREAMRVALEHAAQAAQPDDSYRDEWFAAKADSYNRIKAMRIEGET